MTTNSALKDVVKRLDALKQKLNACFISEYEEEDGTWVPDVDIEEHNKIIAEINNEIEGLSNIVDSFEDSNS